MLRFVTITLLAASFLAQANAQASIQLCENNQPCLTNFTESCPDMLAKFTFSGTCCSLADDGTGCQVTVTGSDGTCNIEDPEPTCTTLEDGSVGCVSGMYLTIMSNNADACPQSQYQTLADPTPSTGGDDPLCEDKGKSKKLRKEKRSKKKCN